MIGRALLGLGLLVGCGRDGAPADGAPDGTSDAARAVDGRVIDAPGAGDAVVPDARVPDARVLDATASDALVVDAAPPADAPCPILATEAACLDQPVAGFGSGGVAPTAPVVAWSAIASDGTFIYLAGTDRIGSGGGDSGWRIEKRDLASGALVAGFGDAGVVRENFSVALDRLELLVIDDSALYAAGADATAGATAPRWRIEKRSLASGALVEPFGTKGVVILSPAGLDLGPAGLAREAAALYIVGREGGVSTTPQQWLIAKLGLSDGKPVAGFGGAGMVRAHMALAGGSALASRVLLAGDKLLVGGQTSGTIFIDKRDAQSGDLVAGFGDSGVVSFAGAGASPSVMVAGADSFLVGVPTPPSPASANSSWRLEKRDLATGALVDDFGSCGAIPRDPTSGPDLLEGMALAGDDLYLLAVDNLGGDGAWRWERRAAATGVLRSLCKSNAGSMVGSPQAVAVTPDGNQALGVGSTEQAAEAAGRIEKRKRP